MKFLWLLILSYISCEATGPKDAMCNNMYCEDEESDPVCGARGEGDGMRLRLFESECELLKFGCQVDDEKGI